MVQAARLLIAPLQILSMGAGSVLGPRAARAFGRGGTVELRRFLGRLAPIWVLAFLAYGALVAVAPEFWLSVLYRGKYAGAGLVVLLWVAVFVVQSGLRRLPSLLLSAMRRPDLGLFISLPAGLLALVLTGVFTRYAGPQWAVAGRLVGAVVSCAAIATCAHLLLRKETLQEEREG